jgi:hypothetical protein
MTKQIDNTAALNAVSVVAGKLTWFASYLKNWHKQAGEKPTDAMLMVPVLLGKRPGVEALHIAMCLRNEGCTVAQFCLAGSCGPANNYRRTLVSEGLFNCVVEGKPYAFKLGVTSKGVTALKKGAERLTAEASTAAEPKAKKAKGGNAKRKAKGAAVAVPVADPVAAETPTSEVPMPSEGQQGEQATA